jgi:hypothetical protein
MDEGTNSRDFIESGAVIDIRVSIATLSSGMQRLPSKFALPCSFQNWAWIDSAERTIHMQARENMPGVRRNVLAVHPGTARSTGYLC